MPISRHKAGYLTRYTLQFPALHLYECGHRRHFGRDNFQRVCKDGHRNGILPLRARGVYPIPDRGGGASSGSNLGSQAPRLPGAVVIRQERGNDFVSKETEC